MNIVDHVFFVCLINPFVICGSFALLLHRNVRILKSVIDKDSTRRCGGDYSRALLKVDQIACLFIAGR